MEISVIRIRRRALVARIPQFVAGDLAGQFAAGRPLPLGAGLGVQGVHSQIERLKLPVDLGKDRLQVVG